MVKCATYRKINRSTNPDVVVRTQLSTDIDNLVCGVRAVVSIGSQTDYPFPSHRLPVCVASLLSWSTTKPVLLRLHSGAALVAVTMVCTIER